MTVADQARPRYAATIRIAVSVDLEELLRGRGEAGLTMQRDRQSGEFVIVPRFERRSMDAAPMDVGERMMRLRLAMSELRITEAQYWETVDAIPTANAEA